MSQDVKVVRHTLKKIRGFEDFFSELWSVNRT